MTFKFTTFVLSLISILILNPNKLSSSENIDFKLEHKGIMILGISKSKQKSSPSKKLPPKLGAQKIKRAIDVIFSKSPFNSKWIKHLQSFGKIIIVYNPAFPRPRLASQIIAAFFPDFYQHSGNIKQWSVVIGHYGINWPEEKLAAVIVHELVGHGLQHLRGRSFYDRKIDRECEALIYEEKAYQDFNTPRDTPTQLRFIKDMRQKWCSDFNRFLYTNNINTDQVWGFGRPNIPYLLEHFEKYIKHLRKTGVAHDAINLTNEKKERDFKQRQTYALERNDIVTFHSIGKIYYNGIGITRNYQQAFKWFEKAAEQNHPESQIFLGTMYERGLGVSVNKIEAYKWFSIAANQSIPIAHNHKNRIASRLTSSELKQASKLAKNWTKLN